MNLKRELWDGLLTEYKNCKLCPIGEHAKVHVFGKGSLTPDVLWVGEGPGKLEDVEGLPFVGLAGRLLRKAIEDAKLEQVKHFFTNLVSCRPCDEVGGPNRTPSELEIFRCSDRLKRTVFIVAPRIVVLLGKVPKAALLGADYLQKYRIFCLPHPAFILRVGGVKSPAFLNYKIKVKEVLNASLQS